MKRIKRWIQNIVRMEMDKALTSPKYIKALKTQFDTLNKAKRDNLNEEYNRTQVLALRQRNNYNGR